MSAFLGQWLLPPADLLLLFAAGFWLMHRHAFLGKSLMGFAWLALWALSAPMVSNALLDSLMPAYRPLDGSEADAIVILAGGSVRGSTEFGQTEGAPKWMTLERIRYGAWLARKLHKPVLVTGGDPEHTGEPEAIIMARVLEEDDGITPRWVETRSRTTAENATDSAALLKKDGITRIYLVSHAWHLPRAIPEFEKQGLTVIAAGTGYHSHRWGLYSFVPSAAALHDSYFALHEWLGRAWYLWHPLWVTRNKDAH